MSYFYTYLAEGKQLHQTLVEGVFMRKYLKHVDLKRNFIAVRDLNVIRVRFHNETDPRMVNSRLNEFIRQEKFNSMCPVTTGVIDINHEISKSHSSAGEHLNVALLHRGGLLIECLHVEGIEFCSDNIEDMIKKVILEFLDDHSGCEDHVKILETLDQMYIYSGDIYSLELGAACYHCGDSPVQYWMR